MGEIPSTWKHATTMLGCIALSTNICSAAFYAVVGLRGKLTGAKQSIFLFDLPLKCHEENVLQP